LNARNKIFGFSSLGASGDWQAFAELDQLETAAGRPLPDPLNGYVSRGASSARSRPIFIWAKARLYSAAPNT